MAKARPQARLRKCFFFTGPCLSADNQALRRGFGKTRPAKSPKTDKRGYNIMDAYQGYTENGKIIPLGNPALPDGRRVIITVLDEAVQTVDRIKRQLDALEKFRKGMEATGPLPDEFEDIIKRRVNITRKIDL